VDWLRWDFSASHGKFGSLADNTGNMKLLTLSVLLIASWLGGCSWTPRAGPSTSEVLDQGQTGGVILFDVVDVDDRVVFTLLSQPKESFARRFKTAGQPPELKIAIGDTVAIKSTDNVKSFMFPVLSTNYPNLPREAEKSHRSQST
jgi:hypothetical protein